jgi:hypothetical protein
MTLKQPLDDRGVPARYPMHCGNECPHPDAKDPDYGPDDDDIYPCGWRHWCPRCLDCEYCYGPGPHEWD